MIKKLMLSIFVLLIYSCSDDTYEVKLSGSELIKQNLLPGEVNGELNEVGIYTIKRNEEGLNDETINCDYFLENSSETAYGLSYSIKYELIKPNTVYRIEDKKVVGNGFVLYLDYKEFFQIYKIDSTSYIQTYEVSKKWATMDLHLKYYKTAHRDYYTNMKDTVEVIAKNVKVRRYSLCDF